MKPNSLLPLTLALLLTACGGGSGGSTNTTNTTYTSTCSDGTTQVSTVSQTEADRLCTLATAPQPSTIVTSVPTDTYNTVTQAEEKAAFALLNAERSACGFGKLAQNALLDTAARGHAEWMHQNSTYEHRQTSGSIGFTGVSSLDRAAAVGYQNIKPQENFNLSYASSKANSHIQSVRGLFSAPYHGLNFLSSRRDIGISIRKKVDDGVTYGAWVGVYDFGIRSPDSAQFASSSEVLTYPCQGTSGVDFRLDDEAPNPVGHLGRNLLTNPVGHPIYVMVGQGRTLTITSTSIIEAATGLAIATLPARTSANDSYMVDGANSAFILPDLPLKPATQYQVTVSGNHGTGPLNRTVFSRTFTFTTGSVNY